MKITKKKIKLAIIIGIIIYALYKITIYSYEKINTKVEIKSANNFALYDSNNNLYFQGSKDNTWVNLEEISQELINATISTEDKNFYNHHGFDILRILKATYTNIISGKTKQGASTITQQYVKNLFLSFDKTWQRKWNEMWLTINVEMHYKKEEILEGYLNTINYGHGMYGIENAANYYFNKSAKDLTLAEASILAGIPKSPSNYSPLKNLELAKKRQLMILEGMVKNGYITNEEKEKAYNTELEFIGSKKSNDLVTLMYYKDAVIDELLTIKTVPTSFLTTGGLKIYTTLDQEMQKSLEESVNKNITDETLQASGIIISPEDGSIKALLGGTNYEKSQYNRATKSKRQVGSTMKPFLYYAALENGFTSSTTFTSEQTTFTFSNGKTYSPKNYSEIYGNRPISLAAAIAYSDNIYAIKTHMFLGEDTLINTARKIGIQTKLEEIPSLPLGTNEISIIEMASAYSTFASGGYKNKAHLITKIEDSKGNILYEYKETKELVLNPSLVFILNNLLTTTYDKDFIDYNYPTVIGIKAKMTRKYSVKSGTTGSDSWTIGFNPNLVTAIWVGYDDNKEIEEKQYSISKNIWIDTMEKSLDKNDKSWYDIPSNVIGVLVDPISGNLASTTSNKKKILYYLKGTEPTVESEIVGENTKE